MKSNKKKIVAWKIKSTKVVLEDKWIKVRADECVTASGVNISRYYVLEYPSWVHMVVMNDKKQILITEQYRHGARRSLFELPCGTQGKKDKDAEDAARRELSEETGYIGNFILAGQISPNPATHSNSIYIFLVTNPVKESRPHEDPTEIINYEFMDLERVYTLIDEGVFGQGLHISSLVLALRKYQKLFSPK